MNSASKALILAAMGGGLYWAYRKGYMGSAFGSLGLGGASPGAVQSGGMAGQGGTLTPSAGTSSGVNRWEQLLWENSSVVSAWAKANRQWVAAMMRVESGTLGSAATSSKGALGLLQVMPDTAKQMFKAGYTHFEATTAVLKTDAGGIYFGTAYLEYLSRIHSDRDWITKAYYGGEKFESQSSAYVSSCVNYLGQVHNFYNDLYGGETA